MSTRTRRRFDDEDFEVETRPRAVPSPPQPAADDHEEGEAGPQMSTYADAETLRGPHPVPAWVVTSPDAVDADLGVLKTGKEAEVSLLRRSFSGTDNWLAVKRYRAAEHRLFHRDAGYLEGRRVRKSRETRAMARRTDFGKQLITGQWATAEFEVLARCWKAGIPVPYPVQFRGTELMMEFIGAESVAAPRLAETHPDLETATRWFGQVKSAVIDLADLGYAHGDLSAYNVLVDGARLVLIDLPQAVDIVGNPQGFAYLHRDCQNICGWFTARGVHADPVALYDAARSAVAAS